MREDQEKVERYRLPSASWEQVLRPEACFVLRGSNIDIIIKSRWRGWDRHTESFGGKN
jgi:hypothetical protein